VGLHTYAKGSINKQPPPLQLSDLGSSSQSKLVFKKVDSASLFPWMCPNAKLLSSASELNGGFVRKVQQHAEIKHDKENKPADKVSPVPLGQHSTESLLRAAESRTIEELRIWNLSNDDLEPIDTDEHTLELTASMLDSLLLEETHSEDKALAAEDATRAALKEFEQRVMNPAVSLQQPSKATTLDAYTPKKWSSFTTLNVRDFNTVLPNPAMRFPFELDTFQKQAVLHLERGENVFCAGHTGSGKTVIAEYCIAMCFAHMRRAIYTSPIKALSNQKFRELRKTFGSKDVGLMTGDVTLNPGASCLIVTTEILRSMLYRGADLIRDVEYVIFDEIHYINDLDRGHVWEETIILLPTHIKLVMLSATSPNKKEFSDWIGRTKQKHVYITATDKRVVPLQHYLWCKNKLFSILDSKGAFHPEAFKNAKLDGITAKRKEMEKKGIVKRGSTKGGNNWLNLLKYLRTQDLLPVVIFSFSKRMCEQSAGSLSHLDLTTSHEKSEIYLVTHCAIQRLNPVDRNLPQITRTADMLRRGIGVHHVS